MEPKEQEQNILIEYGYLESLLKHYSNPYDKKNLSLKEFFILLHRIIFKIKETSKKSDVERTEKFFYELIKTSFRLDKDSLLFKALSYFIQNGFDEFIKVLKDSKVITPKEFNKSLLNILDSEKIENSFQLNKGEVEKVLNIPVFKKTFVKIKFKNKIMCFILFFFRDFVEKKDQQIMDGIKGYLDEDKINSFYTIYDKEIEKTNIPESINNINNNEANDANQDNENMIFIQKTNESSPNQEKETETPAVSENSNINKNLVQELSSSNGHETKSLINNEDNIAQIKKELEDLRKANETSNKKIDELNEKIKEIDPLKNKVAELETNYKILDKKLSLSLVINHLNGQRDSYKASLEIILKKIIEVYELDVKENGEPLWKRTKEICNLLKEKEKNENMFEKMYKMLTCLLFCKDYSNVLVHGKGKFSETINKYYYEKKDSTEFIPVASYKNMKETTLKFFGSSVRELEEFKYINLLLLDKIKDWKEPDDFDYHEYLTEDGLDCDEIIADFEIAVKIMEDLKLTEEINKALEKN